MRKTLLLGALLLVAACSPATNRGPAEAALRLTFDTTDAAVRTELTKKSITVIERRLSRYGATMEDLRTAPDGSGVTLRLTLPDADLADELTTELAMPYTFAIVREDAKGGTGALTFEGQGTFVPTSVTEEDLAGAEWAPDGGGAAVRLVFTDAGKKELAALSASGKDQIFAIVARGVLMSKTRGDALQGEVVIRGIPTPEFAEVFVDDVNVGLHVTFTPIR